MIPSAAPREITEARDYALAVVQTVRGPLVVLDAECRVGLANAAFYRLFGDDPTALEGRRLWEARGSVWNDPELRRHLTEACAGKETVVDLEIVRHIPPIGDRILVLNARAIAREGRPSVLLLSVEDVTDARQAERLRVDAETLRLVDRRKDEFLGVLAHELRNPLAPMRFALEILKQAEGKQEAGRAREVLERQVGHLVRLIDDLLDVSRIALGKIELQLEPVDLREVVGSAVELCRPAIDAAHHALTVSVPDEPLVVRGDSVRLTQILVNLLNNAVKFTPPAGHIWLIAERAGEEFDAAGHGAAACARYGHRDCRGSAPPGLRDVRAGRPLAGALARRPGRGLDARAESGRHARRHSRSPERRTRSRV